MYIDTLTDFDKPAEVRIAESVSESAGAPPHELQSPFPAQQEVSAKGGAAGGIRNEQQSSGAVPTAHAQAICNEVLIRGITSAGRTFRPSDWAERLAGVMSTFAEDNRLGYSPYVRPTVINGVKSVIVDSRLKDVDERAYNFLLNFGRDNDLVIEDLKQPEAA
jgi:hypothetical protein